MRLKRIYDTAPDWEPKWAVRRDRGGQVILDEHLNTIKFVTNPPPLKNVQLLSAKERQHFSTGFVTGAQSEGWLVLEGNKLQFKTEPPIVYRIERKPGYYCCHCKQALVSGDPDHVATKHAGKKSPDASNPAGYERINYFDCVKES